MTGASAILDMLTNDTICPMDKIREAMTSGVLPAELVDEFVCRRTEATYMRLRKSGHEPDPRYWAGLKAKRKWMRGEIDSKQLKAADNAVWDAACEYAMRKGAIRGLYKPNWQEQVDILIALIRERG